MRWLAGITDSMHIILEQAPADSGGQKHSGGYSSCRSRRVRHDLRSDQQHWSWVPRNLQYQSFEAPEIDIYKSH